MVFEFCVEWGKVLLEDGEVWVFQKKRIILRILLKG